jgi:rubredoxin
METTLSDRSSSTANLPPHLQCPHCGIVMLFLGCTPSERSHEWICPSCRTMKIRPMAWGTALSGGSTAV